MGSLMKIVSCILFTSIISMKSSIVDASSLDNFTIIPKDPYYENGTNVTLRCHLESNMWTARDLVWYAFVGQSREFMPDSSIRIVNDSVSELHLIPYLGDTTYCCALPDDLSNYDASVVHIGYKPDKVKNFVCYCRTIRSFWCQWEVVQGSHRFFTDTYFRYKPSHGSSSNNWKNCPELRRVEDENLLSCTVSADNDVDYNLYQYIVEVIASNELGNVTSSSYIHPSFEAIPYPPQHLDGEALDGYRLNMTWGLPYQWPPHYELECELGYRKKVSPVEPELDKSTKSIDDCTSVMEKIIDDLHPFTTYEISIRARHIFNFQEWSEWSDEFEIVTLNEAPSGKVSNLRKLSEDVLPDDPSLRKVVFVWDEVPADQCNGEILGYNVYVTKDEYTINSEPAYNVSSTRRYIEIIVDQFDTFRVYVVAFNSAGEGQPNFPLDIFDRTSIPGKPVNIETTALSKSSVFVQWSAPVEAHGRIFYYMVDRKKTTQNEEWITEAVDGSEYSFLVDDLDPYTFYEFRVQANNSAGLGAWSESSQVRTREAEPSSFPRDIKLVTMNDKPTKLLLTWRPPYTFHSRGKILTYNIYFCEKNIAEFSFHNASDELECDEPRYLNFTDIDEHESPESYYIYILTDLNTYSEYLLWMSASNIAGEGILSHRMSARTDEGVPEKPDPPVEGEVDAFSVELHWEAPDKPNGNITRYIISYNSSATEMLSKEVDGTSVVITENIFGNLKYAFAVSACNDHHCSDFSDPVHITTLVGVPEPVYLFNVNLIATDKVELTWLEPVHPNGVISHYIVSYRPENITDSKWKNRTVRGLRTTIQVDCAEGASFFTYVIRAVTTNGSKILLGDTFQKRFEMCRKFPVPVIIMAVLIPSLVVMMAVACFYIIKVKKIELFKPFPEPRFIEDFIIKPWDAPLKPEKEHFDQLKSFNDRYTAPPNKMQERTVSKTSSGIESDQGFDESEIMGEIPDKTTKAAVCASGQGMEQSVSEKHRENGVDYFEEDDAVFEPPVDNEYYPIKVALLKRDGSFGSNGSVEYHTMGTDGLIAIDTSQEESCNSVEHPSPISNDYQCMGRKDFVPPCLNTSASVDTSSTTSDYPASPDSYEYGVLGHTHSTSPLSPVSVSIPRDAPESPDHCNKSQQVLLLAPLNQQNNNKPAFSKTNNLRNEPDVSGDYVCSPNTQTEDPNDNIDPYTVIPICGGSPPQTCNSMPYSQLSVRPTEIREGNLSDGFTKCNYSRIPDCPLTPPASHPSKSLDSYLPEKPQTDTVDRTDKGTTGVFEVPDSGIDSDHSNNSLGIEIIPVDTPQELNVEDGKVVSLPTTLAGNTVVQRPQTQIDIEPLIIDDLFTPSCELDSDLPKTESLMETQNSNNISNPIKSSEGDYVVSPVL
ncbi:uncharacterized protein [Antedon mediterranea]|uniref:uncharacterized protein n=1 Tax=Antedon mediterranea TaxID=105859 RepID=UPI003AF6A80C